MHFESDLNYLAILVSAVVIFILGGLWYSPALFARPWVRLMGKSEEELKARPVSMPLMFLQAFITGLITSYGLAFLLHISGQTTAFRGAHVALWCWLAFTGATSYTTSLFSGERRALWAINSGYHLVSLIAAGAILGGWQ